jgi:DNA polymerase-1
LGGDNADDFQRQVDIARGALPRLGIPAPAVPRYEADDILGTFAVQIAESGDTAFIVSTDRDLLQLVRDRIAVIVPGRDDARVDSEDIVRDRLGVPPAGVTTWKALCGDPSDNIPGVQGVGTKTAAALTNRYGTLEAIFEHLEELPRRQATLLDAQREDAFLFRRIVTIKTDLDTAVDIADVTEPSVTAESKPRPLLEQVGLGDARS